jgi:hypothetical protein
MTLNVRSPQLVERTLPRAPQRGGRCREGVAVAVSATLGLDRRPRVMKEVRAGDGETLLRQPSVLLAAWIMLGIGGLLVVAGSAIERRAPTAAGSALALLAGVTAIAIRRPPRPWAWRSLLLVRRLVSIFSLL